MLPCKALENSLKRVYPSVSAPALLRHRQQRAPPPPIPGVPVGPGQTQGGENKEHSCAAWSRPSALSGLSLHILTARNEEREWPAQTSVISLPRCLECDNPRIGQCPVLPVVQPILCSVFLHGKGGGGVREALDGPLAPSKIREQHHNYRSISTPASRWLSSVRA